MNGFGDIIFMTTISWAGLEKQPQMATRNTTDLIGT